MSTVHVSIDSHGRVLDVSGDDAFVEQWIDGGPSAPLVPAQVVTRLVPGYFYSSTERLAVHRVSVPGTERQPAEDQLDRARVALESVRGSAEQTLCMLLATHAAWRSHYPTMTAVTQWLDGLACPDSLECVYTDLRNALGRHTTATGIDGILDSMEMRAALPEPDDRAHDLDVRNAPSVLSALLASAQPAARAADRGGPGRDAAGVRAFGEGQGRRVALHRSAELIEGGLSFARLC